MFNLYASLFVIAALVAVYIIVRIKHGKPLFEAFSGGAWLDNWIAWIVAFRSWVATFIAGILVALPDLIVQLLPVDFSPFIGENYAKIVGGALAIFLAINNAFKTKPDNVKAE